MRRKKQSTPSATSLKKKITSSRSTPRRLGEFALLHYAVVGVLFHTGHEVHLSLGQLHEPLIIGVAAIDHQRCPGREIDLARNFDLTLPSVITANAGKWPLWSNSR